MAERRSEVLLTGLFVDVPLGLPDLIDESERVSLDFRGSRVTEVGRELEGFLEKVERRSFP